MKQQAFLMNPNTEGDRISLKGLWSLKLDAPYLGEIERWWLKDLSGEYSINLPSSLETAGIGYPASMPARGRPARKFEYEGFAWYQRKVFIPEDWTRKRICFFMERCNRSSKVWIDGNYIGTCDSISTPHVYNTGSLLTPGEHTITVLVNNTYAFAYGSGVFIGRWASAVCDDLQTNWNGIIGEIMLLAEGPAAIESCIIVPYVSKKQVSLSAMLVSTDISDSGNISLDCRIEQDNRILSQKTFDITDFDKSRALEFEMDMPDDTICWDHEIPKLCKASLTLRRNGQIMSDKSSLFGYREFTTDGTNFSMNGNKVFIRGSVEYTGFPKTGHVPMDEAMWEHIFSLSQKYGINHYRFHSYCPPEAAFNAADRLGITFQVELPIWDEKTGNMQQEELVEFMELEGERILYNYANHPSFTMLCLGNELKGNYDALDSLIRRYKSLFRDKLYTFTSNYISDNPTSESDFFVSDHTEAEILRINFWTKVGRFQSYMDGTDYDYSKSVSRIPVPLLAHELGQWSSYPDFSYLDNYERETIFNPVNERIFVKSLEKSGMKWQNKDFHYASGRFSWLLYKEEMETCMRTKGMGGYLLLSLADSPGFGEAFTGAVDPWWKPKSFIKPEEIRRFCNTVVPLLRFKKYVWMNSETFEAGLVIANYGKTVIDGCAVLWKMTSGGKVLAEGRFSPALIANGGPVDIGKISKKLSFISEASEIKITVSIENTEYENDWSIWIYPADLEFDTSGICITRSYSEAVENLCEGRDVLLFAGDDEFDLQETRFLPIFWSLWWFMMTDLQPGNMSVLCDPSHPALRAFPTNKHSNWQWWEIIEASRAFRIDGVPEGYSPIVQIVDDLHRNSRLGTIVEAKVEKGRLIACSNDLFASVEQRPAAKQLLYSVIRYMKSEEFKPALGYNSELLKKVLGYRK